MKTHRKRHLPAGWYPETASEAAREIDEWRDRYPRLPETFIAGVAPHAGWGFSGALAFAVIQQFAEDTATVVVAGGHLPPGGSVLIAPEEAYDTPFGPIEADAELRDRLDLQLPVSADRLPDNTVEVHLPIVRYLFPSARCLSMRCPPSEDSSRAGRVVAEYARSVGRPVAVIGSTDLTHYGPDYGFEPKGTGADALEWARGVNDRYMIDALVEGDTPRILEAGNRHRAACSAGGANAAAVFATEMGSATSMVIDHFTSHDVFPRHSFVGYVGLGFVRP